MQNNIKEKEPKTLRKLMAHPYFSMGSLAGLCLAITGIWWVGFSEGRRHSSSEDNPFAASSGQKSGFSWGGASDWAKDFLSKNFPWAASSSWADRSAGSGVRVGDSQDNLGALKPGEMPGDRRGRRGDYGRPSASYGKNEGGMPGYGAGSGAGGSGGAGSRAEGRGGDYSAAASMRRTGSDGRGGAHGRGLGSADRTGLSGGGLFGAQRSSTLGSGGSDEETQGSKKESAISDAKKKGVEEKVKQRIAFKDEIRAVIDRTAEPHKKLVASYIIATLRDLQAQQTLQTQLVAPRARERADRVSSNIDNNKSVLTALASKYNLPLGHMRRLDSLSKDLDVKLKSLDALKRESDASRSLTSGLIEHLSTTKIGTASSKLRDQSALAHSSMEEGFKEYAAKEKEFIALNEKYDRESAGDRTLIAGEAKPHVDKARDEERVMASAQAEAKQWAEKLAIAEAQNCSTNPNPDLCRTNQAASVAAFKDLLKNALVKLDTATKNRDAENAIVSELNSGFENVNAPVSGLFWTARAFQISQAERDSVTGRKQEGGTWYQPWNDSKQNQPSNSLSAAGSAEANANGVRALEAELGKISADYFTLKEPGQRSDQDKTLILPLADLGMLNGMIGQGKEEMALASRNFMLAQKEAQLGKSDAISLNSASADLVKSFITVGQTLDKLAELEKEAPARITAPGK